MQRLTSYIIEKLRLNKDYHRDVHFFELSENELIERMIDIIERHNKKYNKNYVPNIYYEKNGGNNPWRAQLAVNISYSHPTITELYAHIAHDYGEFNDYNEVKDWKFDKKKNEWIER